LESPQYVKNADNSQVTTYFQDVIGPEIANIPNHITHVFKCPSAQNIQGGWLLAADACDYRYNCYESSHDPNQFNSPAAGHAPGRRLSNVANPSAALLLADQVFPGWPLAWYPHDGINCGYVDGHAEWVSTQNYCAQGVGCSPTPSGTGPPDPMYRPFWTTGWH
jgi:prepilin-type processing-associated H-X9-DG protein